MRQVFIENDYRLASGQRIFRTSSSDPFRTIESIYIEINKIMRMHNSKKIYL